ncbi:hypothetical protein H106_00720 [Trichophyton rubrum CBS 735.88]|nr:hypothetical protein H106_00720 [Trichophyton rubrum CBS 735.88]
MLPEADPDMVINAFSPVPLGRGAHRDAESHQHAVPHMVGKKRYGRAERERWTPTGNMHMPHRQTPALNLGGDLKNVGSEYGVGGRPGGRRWGFSGQNRCPGMRYYLPSSSLNPFVGSFSRRFEVPTGEDGCAIESSAAVEINSAFVIGRSKLRKAVERRKAGGDGPPLAAAYH